MCIIHYLNEKCNKVKEKNEIFFGEKRQNETVRFCGGYAYFVLLFGNALLILRC